VYSGKAYSTMASREITDRHGPGRAMQSSKRIPLSRMVTQATTVPGRNTAARAVDAGRVIVRLPARQRCCSRAAA
jgi:hypothetical protein